MLPTVLDLLLVPARRPCIPQGPLRVCRPLDGKSLAPVILGLATSSNNNIPHHGRSDNVIDCSIGSSSSLSCRDSRLDSAKLPLLSSDFSIQQKLVCWQNGLEHKTSDWNSGIWRDCNLNARGKHPKMASLLGYSYRTADFRYNAWFHFNLTTLTPMLNKPIFAEELYDHRSESLSSFGYLELNNIVSGDKSITEILISHRNELIAFIRTNISFPCGKNSKEHVRICLFNFRPSDHLLSDELSIIL